ncbi:MAG TPA: PASTA domain-containing protein [Acidimicrobiales bacterium]|jgi:serine/threonine-protein kinase
MPLISDSIGRVLGKRYRLVSALGAGASAHVFLAEDVSLQRHVAVKVLQPGLAKDEAFLKRFGAEARSVASLNHPHVLRVFDWGEDADGPYLVLEYLGGGSLRDLLDGGVQLTPAQAARLGVEAAQGLAYAHARGLVHRDVKPANLLFDEEGRVRIADFGVARALAQAAWTEPVGAMVGTARYASPEQAEGRNLDGRADVYSLALVLYEAVTGVVPFVADTTVGTLMARVGQPLPSHRLLGPLDAVLSRAAAPDSSARLTATQLADRLEAVAAGLPAPDPLPLRVISPSAPSLGTTGIAPQVVPSDLTAVAVSLPAPDGEGAGAPDPARPRSGPGEVFDHEALAGTGAVRSAPPPAAGPVPTVRRRRRRWPWIAGVVALAAIVVAGLLVARAERVFTPSHPVPRLGGMTLAQARQALSHDHFTLAVGAATYSTTVAAGLVVSQQPAATHQLKQGSTVRVVPSKGPPSVAVPSLLGVDCSVASRLLSEANLKATCPALSAYSSTVPAGQVLNWSYDNQIDVTNAPYGSTILVAVSKGPAPIPIPGNLAGGTYAAAQSALGALGFTVTQAQESSTTVPSGQVTRTVPAAGTPAPVGSSVTVYVSNGPPIVTIPNLTKDTVAQATAALNALGLNVGQTYGPPGGKVFTTVPLANQQLPAGQSVNLYLQ